MEIHEAPVISDRFDLEDIRKIREYNSLRHANMRPEEIIEDIRNSGGEALQWAMEHAIRVL